MEQYFVFVQKAREGMKHLNILETVKYEFQNNPKNDRIPSVGSRRTRVRYE
jgi:hypothetical protein